MNNTLDITVNMAAGPKQQPNKTEPKREYSIDSVSFARCGKDDIVFEDIDDVDIMRIEFLEKNIHPDCVKDLAKLISENINKYAAKNKRYAEV